MIVDVVDKNKVLFNLMRYTIIHV